MTLKYRIRVSLGPEALHGTIAGLSVVDHLLQAAGLPVSSKRLEIEVLLRPPVTAEVRAEVEQHVLQRVREKVPNSNPTIVEFAELQNAHEN